jgi:hypothetical protein
MICPQCHGKRTFPAGKLLHESPEERCEDICVPCTTCQGQGVIHCCEGEQEQPEY